MVETYIQEMTAHPEFVPSFVDMTGVLSDRALRAILLELRARVAELLEALDDTGLAAGSDLFIAFMAFCAIVNEAARRGVPGADDVLANLQRFIPRLGSPAPPPTPRGHKYRGDKHPAWG